MTRLFGLVAVLSALAVGAYVFAVQSQKEGQTANAVTQVEAQAASAAAGTNFQGAAQALQAWYAANGTYGGATLPPGSGVLLIRADAGAYCLQTPPGSAVEHELGPGGSPQPGPC
jgi:type II secretory pathway pseudopilin PulG